MKSILISLLLASLFLNQISSQPIAASFYSNQPKSSIMKGIQIKKTEVKEFPQTETKMTQNKDENYIYYIFETPQLFNTLTTDDFKIDVTEKLISVKGKVGMKEKLYNLHRDDEKSTYHAVAMLEVPLKPGCMPVNDKETLSNNRFRITVKINKYCFQVPFESMVKSPNMRADHFE